MSVLCDVGVYVRSMYMSGRCVCEINVYVNIWLPAAMVAVWRVSGMWGSVVGSLVCGARGMCSK